MILFAVGFRICENKIAPVLLRQKSPQTISQTISNHLESNIFLLSVFSFPSVLWKYMPESSSPKSQKTSMLPSVDLAKSYPITVGR